MSNWKKGHCLISDWLYQKIWLKIRGNKDEELKNRFRLLGHAAERDLEENVCRYRKRQIGMLLLFTTVVVFLFLIAICFREDETGQIRITRNSYGEGEREEVLILEDGETIPFTVGEQVYTAEELEQAFSDGFDWIRENMLGSNASAGDVRSDLNFLTEVPGGITAEWISDSPEVISYDGQVQNEDFEEGDSRMVSVSLSLFYQEEMRTQTLYFEVKAPMYTEREKTLKEIAKAIQNAEEKTREQAFFELPEEIAGVEIQKEQDSTISGVLLLVTASFFFLFFYNDNRMKEQMKERKQQLEEDYPMLINKIVLYLGAGMNLRRTFSQIGREYHQNLQEGHQRKRYVYDELLIMLNDLEAGAGEINAYEAFGKRLGVSSYGKMIALLIQNLQKGNDGLLGALRTEESNAFFLRIDQAKKQGEEAGTKLLFPMLLMMVIVMIIVMAPALMQFAGY